MLDIATEAASRWLDALDGLTPVDESLRGGHIFLDRPLPYLCAARRRPDDALGRLAVSQAAHAFLTDASGSLSEDLGAWARHMTDRFDAFLVIELWETPDHRGASSRDASTLRPGFRIVAPEDDRLQPTVDTLARALKHVAIHKQPAQITFTCTDTVAPPEKNPLVETSGAPVYLVGVEIDPVYRDREGDLFPFLLEQLRHDVDDALKQTFAHFTRTLAGLKTPGYRALGRRALDARTLQVDHELAVIDDSFDFLLQTTPVNARQAWSDFKASGCQIPPVFYYRPLPVDPERLKRRLFDLPLEHLPDPTIGLLLREKAEELDRRLTMLRERDTRQFFYSSLQLYGEVQADLLALAEDLLDRIPSHDDDLHNEDTLDEHAFADLAYEEFAHYRRTADAFPERAEIRDDMPPSLMVSRGQLLIGRGVRVPHRRADALLQHEVGTHMLTYFNGNAQPLRLLATGLAGYETLQEGLAVLAELLVGGLTVPRMRVLAARVVAANCLIDDASFLDVFRLLTRTHQFDENTAFTIAMRTFRGGGFIKDVVYLRGLHEVLKHLRDGHPLEPLFAAKIALHHTPLLDELVQREVLRPTPLLPRFLERDATAHHLERVRSGLTFIDLVEHHLAL